MNSYFYHGIESYSGYMGSAVQLMIKILKEGIIIRNKARNYDDDKYNHVCLYRKNDEYDYGEESTSLRSAREGWINKCFVFVINPQIEARKARDEETDLIDEWRCYNNILPNDIVGIALPFETIEEYLNEQFEQDEEDKKILKESLPQIMEITKQLNIPVYNSDEDNFTDKLDSTLEHSKV